MAKSFNELLTGHYNELLDTPMNEGQEATYLAYLDGADYSTVKDFPECNTTKEEYYGYIDDHLEGSVKKANMAKFIRFLFFIYSKHGYEAFASSLSKTLDSYRGLKPGDFFFNGSPLTAEYQIVYYLYELNDQIHKSDIDKFKAKVVDLQKSYPDEFEKTASNPSFLVRLRAQTFLYPTDETTFGKMLDKTVSELKVTSDNAEIVFNACTFSSFKHKGLCNLLVDIWRKFPSRTTDRISWNKHYYPDFLEKSLYSKDYPYEDNPPCENEYFKRLANAISLSDYDLCLGIIAHCSNDSELKYAAEFLKNYPNDYLAKCLTDTLKTNSDIELVFAKYRKLFEMTKTDRTPLVKLVTELYDKMLTNEINDIYKKKDRGPSYNTIMTCLFDGDMTVLPKFISSNHASMFNTDQPESFLDEDDTLGGYLYGISKLLGYFAEENSLKEKIKRFANLLVAIGLPYSYARFIGSAMQQYNWNGNDISTYILDCEPEFAPIYVIRFYDELLLSDKEKGDKDIIITQEMSDELLNPAKEYIKSHQEAAGDFLKTMEDFDCGLLKAYADIPEIDPVPMVGLLNVKEKKLRERVVKYIGRYPAARPLVEELQNAKRKDIRTFAEKALAAFDDINAFVLPGTQSEKATIDTNFDIVDYAKKNMPKTADKLLGTFTDPNTWPAIRYADKDEKVNLDIIKCYVCLYAQNKDMQRIYSAEKMRAYFNSSDMESFSILLFNEWCAAGRSLYTNLGPEYNPGGDSKTKGIMTLLGIHGGEEGVKLIVKLIPSLLNFSRSAMAGDAVKAIAISQSVMSLVVVDNMARVHRNKLVRRVAGETIAAAAESMGLTIDQMSDKIVPSLGLNEMGELHLDTGAKKFKVVLQSDLKVKLFKEDGKEIKSFPSWDFDNEKYELHEEAKAMFNTLKKELKNLVKIQTERLELSLSKGREWDTSGYNELFIINPIMQRFATSLIFGVYQDGKLINSFRYAGDGSFCDINDETFVLQEDITIKIAHPLDLTEQDIKAWQGQLKDYEIKQPFLQLARPVFDAEVSEDTSYKAFSGKYVNGYFISKMFKFDWFHGGIGDGGSFYCIFFDGPAGISACLEFCDSFPYMGGTDEDIGIGEITFYKKDCVKPSYDLNINDLDKMKLKDIPKNVFSEVLYRVKQGIDSCLVSDN